MTFFPAYPRDLSNDKYDLLLKSYRRYEKVRKLTPYKFILICDESLKTGVPFDELIDRLTKE